LHAETITDEEQSELLRLVEQIEEADAERLRRLVELAQLRQVPLDALLDQLGLCRPTYA
jgi:hemerythrin superfamily protein